MISLGMLILQGCLVPSTLGLRTDGMQPGHGGWEAGLGAGVGTCKDCDGWTDPLVGAQAAVGVHERVALAGYAATNPENLGGAFAGMEARFSLAGLDDAVPAASLVVGVGGQAWEGADPVYGARLAVVGSVPAGWDLRPYLGMAWEPILFAEMRGLNSHLMIGGGLTWRPVLGERLRLLVQAEATPGWFIPAEGDPWRGMGTGLMVGLSSR